MAEYGLPQRVVDKALEMGASRECIDAGPDHGSCLSCTTKVLGALHLFYHGIPTDVVADLIRLDIAAEQEETR